MALITRLAQRLAGGRFAWDFLLTAGSNITIAVAGTLGGILAARLLGPTGRGEFAAAIVWAGMFGTLAQLGLPQAITYQTARHEEHVGAILQAVLTLLVIQSVGAILFGLLIAELVLARFQPDAVPAVLLYLWSIPATMLITYLGTISQGMRRFDLFGLLRVLPSLNYLLVLVLAFSLDIRRPTTVLFMMLVGQVILAIGALVMLLRRVTTLGDLWRVHWIRPLTAYGLKSYLGSLSWIVNARLDQFVMSFVVSLEQLGRYSVAVSYAGVLFPILGSFAHVLFPYVAAEERRNAAQKIWRVLGTNLLVGAIGAWILGMSSRLLVPLLFGLEFTASIDPAQVLLAGTVLLSGNYVLSDALRGLGRPGIPSIAEVIGLIVTLLGLLVLLQVWGIMGAAWTSVFSYGSVFIVLIVYTRRILRTVSV